MRVMPSVASGRYSPGPGTEILLGEGIYQEIRPAVANCSPEWPGFLATESFFPGFYVHYHLSRRSRYHPSSPGAGSTDRRAVGNGVPTGMGTGWPSTQRKR